MCDFDSVGPEFLNERNRLFEVIKVLTMDDQVDRESDAVLTDPSREFDLVSMRLGPCDPVGALLLRVLKAELDVV